MGSSIPALMRNRWANRIAVCGGGEGEGETGFFASPSVFFFSAFFFSVFFALFSRCPFSHCFSCSLSRFSFLSFSFSVFLSLFPFTLSHSFSSWAVPLFVSISGFLVWLRRVARLGRAIERSWLALPGRHNLGRAGRLCRCAPRLAPGLAPRRAACSVWPLARQAGGWGRDKPASDFPARLPDPWIRTRDQTDADGGPMGARSAALFNKTLGGAPRSRRAEPKMF